MIASSFIKTLAMTILTVMASVTLAGAQGVNTDQTEYGYPSHAGTYQPSQTYVICSGSDCHVPTPKRHLSLAYQKEYQAQPLQIDPSKLVPRQAIASVKSNEVLVIPQVVRETLYFEYNSARLTECDRRKLDVIKQSASESGSRITITGYTDKKGSRQYNNRLALQRAETITRYLGLSKKAIVLGKGKCCYLDESRDGKNRRGEIVIERELRKKAEVQPVVVKQPGSGVTDTRRLSPGSFLQDR